MGLTFRDASQKWQENLLFTQDLEDTVIGRAMLAAAIGGGPGPVLDHWKGYRKDDVSKEAFWKKASDLLVSLGFRRVFCWADELMPETGWFFHDDAAVLLTSEEKDVAVEVVFREGSGLGQAVKDFCAENIDEIPPAGTVYMMVSGRNGNLEFNSVGQGGHDLERGNYPDNVLEAYDRIREDLGAEVPRGRLSIVSGPPGTGKTYLIRALLSGTKDVVFVIVPQHALTALVEPGGIAALTRLRTDHDDVPIVLILEDSDDALARRGEGDASVISTLLNIGDGIMGSVLDIRMLATTNREVQDFDPAVERPGRLSTSIHVGTLTTEHARRIYERLTEKPAEEGLFAGAVTVAQVYQAAYDKGWKASSGAKKKGRVGFGA